MLLSGPISVMRQNAGQRDNNVPQGQLHHQENQYLPQPEHTLLLSGDVQVTVWFYLHGKSKVLLRLGVKKSAFEAKLSKTLHDFRFCAISIKKIIFKF